MDKPVKMNRTKLKLSDLNPHLMCVLCGGYYIDATTIVECLHSFCRSCIVKHLESSKYCPICEVQVHKTKPLINIRADKTLQDIVYKLVPGLFANEMRNRRKFYKERPHYMKPNDSESVGEVSDETKIYINDENITLSLDYHTSSKHGIMENSFQEIATPVKSEKRYFKCPTGVTIYHLQKLIKAKYDLNDNNYKVEIFFKDQPLHEEFTLLDISYIYLWKSKGTLDLTFKIYENVVKRQKIEETKEVSETMKEEPKEVEVKSDFVEVKSPKPEGEAFVIKLEEESINEKEEEASQEVKTEPMEAKPDVVMTSPEVARDDRSEAQSEKSIEEVKENGVSKEESKEVQLQISESGVMSVSQVENGEVVRTVEESVPKLTDNFRDNTNTGTVPGSKVPKITESVGKPERSNRLIPEQSKQAPKPVKPYKTIRCSPKSWNPVIPKEKLRPTLMKNSDEPKKPLKFFKMRNMPRFLGNPSSGVKPMFAESGEGEATTEARRSDDRKDAAKAAKNILKIDPKTLRPIEKEEMPIISAPSTPNLLTNPFIPNNNHFLFSDPMLLHPNSGNFGKSEKHNNNNNNSSNNNYNSNGSGSSNSNGKPSGSCRPPPQNGTFPPICFPSPDYCSNFFPYQNNFPKRTNFYPGSEKIDPLIRASRLSPFPNLPGFNVAGFHASLPPSISLLLKHQTGPHHHFKKSSQSASDKKPTVKEESTKETNKNCDDNSLKVDKDKMEGSPEKVPEKESAKEEQRKEKDLPKKEEECVERANSPTTNAEEEKPKSEEENKKVEEASVNGDEPTNKDSNNDNSNAVKEEKKDEESTCQEATSACYAEAKPETVDNKSVNDKER